ncbi:MAG TPA: FAD-linked oxidase C-terminal domain-containing protein [Noviherbaspirillum sp.]|uniref:FAD-binding and (Fe-S)-binding domain-containing protein n=1 Tax=Noviherbaspirillum sp. TaxID=1926288 RepID=UPI002B4A4132|nr:FAD-linked oxidase C-terminal domain-containing protein [Noviherbaspirillum sp.]HJV83872.1 FAD-linked oxidase C-terminal domain-containing protein [Noviherbaspirillum sp.]
MLRSLVDTRPSARRAGAASYGDMKKLETELARSIEGEVRFDAGSRALYATDASNYRQVPIGVVIPRTVEDVVTTVRLCWQYGAPVLSRGGGTSLCGQCCNVAVVMDFSKYLNKVIEIDRDAKTARVQPGCVLDDLRDAAGKVGLTFAPDPATHTHNTLGGMIGNNSCGPHSVMGGETVHNVIELDILTYDGERMTVGETSDSLLHEILAQPGRRGDIYDQLQKLRDRYTDEIRRRFPQIPRRVSGYNLEALLPEHGFNVARALVGSESTCVVILEAKLRLLDKPAASSLVVLGYKDVYEAGDHVPEVMKHKPIALEGMDDRLIGDMKAVHLHPENVELLPKGGGWLLVEFGGNSKEDSDDKARAMMDALSKVENPPSMKLYDDPPVEKNIWKVRESGLGATAHVPNQKLTWEGWEDSSVPPENLGKYLRALRALFEKYGYMCDLYGHFGQGCVHTRIDFDLETAPGIAKFRDFLHEAAHLVTSLHGSISGEHGDGQSKAELLPIMFGDELMQAFREFKRIWDPQGKMNPGKVIDAYRADENLRIGTEYDPPPVKVHFHYPDDNGNFPRALLRCVGVGECRKKSGTMCPSYMATGEEMHATRGRARLLFEMLQGSAIHGGWKEPAVHEALDLCLSCKGCKGECPVNVDMATWKAEFMAHYYDGKMRPPAAYAFGLIDRWAKLASHMPSAANFLTHARPFSTLAKKIVGIAPQREITRFAAQPFTHWFRSHERRADGRKVILWPDTFNNYFHPDVAIAAVEVLEHAGCRVEIPRMHLCCGRPLYEFGMLERAKAYLQRIMDALADDIHGSTPIIGLEPACVSVFRDELPNLFPYSEQAMRLSGQVQLLSEFLERDDIDFSVPALQRKAVVHAHCHHKSILHTDAEMSVLQKLKLDVHMPDSGCCGMAGSYGFVKEKYDVSMACGERVLLPTVRAAAQDTLLIADGFSCREQIAQTTGREALHLAQVLRMALHQ